MPTPKIILLSLALLSLTSLSIQRITLLHKSPPQVLGQLTKEKVQGFPDRLKIPKLHIDANVQYLGLTTSGEMDVPNDTSEVGWFDLGVLPGEMGSAVIAGHLDGQNGKAGVFANLNQLKPGDELYIQDREGKTLTFVVRFARTYHPGYVQEVFAPSDAAHLNLITCDGTWDKITKSYSKRLVIFTDLVR